MVRQKHPSSSVAVQSSRWQRTPGCVRVEETVEGSKSAERPSRGDSYPNLADPRALQMLSLQGGGEHLQHGAIRTLVNDP